MPSQYTLEHGTDDLSNAVRTAINQIIASLCETAGISREDIWQISFVGNTCMHHLFWGIFPGALVHSPYNPSLSNPLLLKAGYYGMPSVH